MHLEAPPGLLIGNENDTNHLERSIKPLPFSLLLLISIHRPRSSSLVTFHDSCFDYLVSMCDYTQVEYACGHLRYTVRAWCVKYQETHKRCPANVVAMFVLKSLIEQEMLTFSLESTAWMRIVVRMRRTAMLCHMLSLAYTLQGIAALRPQKSTSLVSQSSDDHKERRLTGYITPGSKNADRLGA